MSRLGARQRGFALLIVLWSLALPAFLVTHVLSTARQETQLARNLNDAATLQAAANGALQQTIFFMLDTSSRHWAADGSTRVIQIGRVPVAVRAEDEADKVNPNFASPALMQALLVQVGADPSTAASVARAIAQWRDAGVQSRPGIATVKSATSGSVYAPTNLPDLIRSLDELAVVPGMTPALLARVRPHLTVFTYGDPDATTHDPVVAQAVSMAGQPRGAGSAAKNDVVSVTADARGPGQAQFAIRATVEINAQAAGHRYRVLAYERIWGGTPQPVPR